MPREITASTSSWGGSTPRPDWVILGSPNSDGSFSVIASASLDTATLTMRSHAVWANNDSEFWASPRSLDKSITLAVELFDMVIITGPDYAACLRALLDTWSPNAASPLSIGTR